VSRYRARGQALAELALTLPLILLLLLAMIEVGFLMSAKARQDGATLETARWAAAHPEAEPSDGAALFGLAGCEVESSEDGGAGTLTVHSTCEYQPLALHGFWEGLDIGSEASAATAPASPGASPSPAPSESPAP
jgi:hypothetical protein